MTKPVMLVILDGFGWREDRADNAVALAKKPNFDRLWAASPHAFLTTCGKVVGLPNGQMGNSEVRHLNIGATEQFKARACELTGWPQPIVGEGRGAQRGKSDVGSRPVVAEREAATADNRLPPIDPYDRCRAGSGNDEAALGPGMSADARGRRVIGGPGQRKMAK